MPAGTKTSAESASAEDNLDFKTICRNFEPMRGAAAGRFFVGVRSGGSAVPGKEGRSAAAGQRSARTSENEKSFSASPSREVRREKERSGGLRRAKEG